jgi:hypothetical protein
MEIFFSAQSQMINSFTGNGINGFNGDNALANIEAFLL